MPRLVLLSVDSGSSQLRELPQAQRIHSEPPGHRPPSRCRSAVLWLPKA